MVNLERHRRNELQWKIRNAKWLKAEIKPNWFTSLTLAPKAKVIHRLDKNRSTVVMVDDKLYLRPVGICGVRPSPLNVHLLTAKDAYDWMTNNMTYCSIVIKKYGRRHECSSCAALYE